MQLGLATAIFIVIYALIATELIHRTTAALLGGMVMVILGFLPQEEAYHAVDWNVIFLLLGMMIIVDITEGSGVFQWLEQRCLRRTGGRPLVILIMLCGLTAVLSALLDNVTTIVLIVPLTFRVARTLGLSPVPLILAQVLASNIGGTATLIGDPPNILIGSAAGLGFLSFLVHLGPPAGIIFLIFLLLLKPLFGRELVAQKDAATMEALLEAGPNGITDPILLKKSLTILGLVLCGFFLHEPLHLTVSTVALLGAATLLLWSKGDPHPRLREIEWSTLLFFVGLFIMVEGLVQVGLIEKLAQSAFRAVGDKPLAAALLTMWMSAIISAIVDNIPFTTVMIPLIQRMGQQMAVEPLWWSLALGACLGGNATIIGASANVIAAGLCEKNGHPITFWHFLRYGVPVTFMSLVVSSLYVWLRYFVI